MKNFLYSGMLVVTVLFSRCGNIPESAGMDSLWDDRTVEVATSTVPCDDEALLTGGMEISGDRVVMYNISQPDLFGCFRLRNDSLVFVAPLQKRGNGPYETLMSQAVFMPECDGLFLIDRQTGRKAFRIDSADPEKWSDVKSWRAFELPNKPNLMSIVPTDCSGGFIAQLLDDRRHMFCTFRSGDSTVAPLSIPYPEASEGCPDISLGIACRGTLQKRPGSQEYVFSAQNSRYVVVFSLKEGQAADIRLLYDTPPQFTLASDGINPRISGETLSGFYVQATRKYIYLTPRNHRDADTKALERSPAFGTAYETFVFDWEGNPVRKILADKPLQTVAFTDDDRFLYAKTADPQQSDECLVRGRILPTE